MFRTQTKTRSMKGNQRAFRARWPLVSLRRHNFRPVVTLKADGATNLV